MDYAEALTKLSEIENGQDMIDAIKAEVQKKGAGEASLRQKLKAYGDIDPQKTKSVFDTLNRLDIDLEGDIVEQLESIKTKVGTADNANSEIKRLQKQFEKLQKLLQAEQEEKSKIAAEKQKTDIFNKMYTEFKDRVSNPDVTLNYRILQGDFGLDENGQIGYKKGDDFVTDNILEAYLKDHPGEAVAMQKNGSGSNPNGSFSKGKINIAEANPYELAKMSPQDIQAAYEQS